MKHLSSLKSAVAGKAPIVAIPVEGHAPACLDRKRLAAWSKGVTVTRIEIEQLSSVTTYTYQRPRGAWIGHIHEGPHEQIANITPGARTLIIEGFAGRVKTRARFTLVDRRTAIKTLAKWTERERVKLEKKTMLGALAKDEKRALKLASYNSNDNLTSITVSTFDRSKDVGTDGARPTCLVRAYGTPVSIPELSEYEFILHRSVDYTGAVIDGSWTVSERTSGLSAASGNSGEDALARARSYARKASPERLAAIHTQIAGCSPAVAA
jgi:hypothetical protein